MIVVDASIAIAWCVESESTDATIALLDRLRADEGVVPPGWPLEVANALLVGGRRGRLIPVQTECALRLLHGLPIVQVERPLHDALDMAMGLGRREALSAYDASYLDLAIRLGFPLATLDGRLRAAARRIGVALV